MVTPVWEPGNLLLEISYKFQMLLDLKYKVFQKIALHLIKYYKNNHITNGLQTLSLRTLNLF